jgi:hypothetical protein
MGRDATQAIRQVAALMNVPVNSEPREVLAAFLQQFSAIAAKLDEEKVALFDLVFLEMLQGSPVDDRILLAQQLAPIPNAPRQLVIDLAFDDEIAVAGPLLRHSMRLDEEALLAIASTKGHGHLAAIAVREIVPETISDVLVSRGTPGIIIVMVRNPGTRFAADTRTRVVQLAFANPDLFVAIDLRSEFGRTIMAAYEKGASYREGANGKTQMRDADAEVASHVGKGEIDRALAIIAMEARTRHGVALRAYKEDTVSSFVIIARAANLSWGTIVGLLLNHFGVTTSAHMINTSRKLFDDTTRKEAQNTTRILGLAEKTIGR